jgi:hypothetical protein
MKVLATSRMVWPSGSAFATAPVPIWVAPPPRFSMVKAWPRRLPTSSDMVRAMMSEVPPAAYGMMTRIGWVGFHCAEAGWGSAAESAKAASARLDTRSASDVDSDVMKILRYRISSRAMPRTSIS